VELVHGKTSEESIYPALSAQAMHEVLDLRSRGLCFYP
jgi:hypothetical protein